MAVPKKRTSKSKQINEKWFGKNRMKQTIKVRAYSLYSIAVKSGDS
jgi:ribosomal protein L32